MSVCLGVDTTCEIVLSDDGSGLTVHSPYRRCKMAKNARAKGIAAQLVSDPNVKWIVKDGKYRGKPVTAEKFHELKKTTVAKIKKSKVMESV